MHQFFADLHVHIGQAGGRPVKITASRELTVRNILTHAAIGKGLDIVGVVDAASPLVFGEIRGMLANGELMEVPGGGLLHEKGILLILGVEIETQEGAHFLSYFPDMESVREYQGFLAPHLTNLNLSTQRARLGVREVMEVTRQLGGIFCPAHVFTPHKGAYGCWVERLERGLGRNMAEIKVLELGLSADTHMASMVAETTLFNFLSNSDAHSLPNVGREYNSLAMKDKNFNELGLALSGVDGRRILANYGLHPRLGKYHRTYCPHCQIIAGGEPPVLACESCGSSQVVMGVFDRLCQISDTDPHHIEERARYFYRVPLLMIPGVGPRLKHRLVAHFGNEIEVLEHAGLSEIARVAGSGVAGYVEKMRHDQLSILPGGGGKYGKVQKN